MARTFEVPSFYRGDLITKIKKERSAQDPRRKDLSPTVIEYPNLTIKIARHFGFCFGVENAIETAYKIVEENPNKRIFLLSEMIHNPQVNADLIRRGVNFLMETNGKRLVDFATLSSDDIVIVPAFGTTLEILAELKEIGIDALKYDATCPFVEKVWKRSAELGKKGFTVIIHGKKQHEETKATFSHAKEDAPSFIVRDIEETKIACALIKQIYKKIPGSVENFNNTFRDACSKNFNPEIDLFRIGVVNQTTMLASETITIANMFKSTMEEIFGQDNLLEHYADTRDTLCYATNENQSATISLREHLSDLSIVVGGHNSSNTSHLVELLSEKMPTYFIKDADSILDKESIMHFNLSTKSLETTKSWLPNKPKVVISLTAGASCPDKVVDNVIQRLNEVIG